MKDRLITAAGALLALAIVYVLFFQKTPQAPVTRPLTIETGRNGYSAVYRWLGESGVRVASLRTRFVDLIEPAGAETLKLAPQGNLLITTMPHALPMRSREHASLDAWIASGNTLLVLAALDDTPEWTAQSATGEFLRDLEIMTGLEFMTNAAVPTPAVVPQFRVPRAAPVDLDPVGSHPLTAGVATLRGYSDDESVLWLPAPPQPFDDRLLLRLAAERETGWDAAWQRVHGSGHVIVVATGSVLANHLIADADAGTFLANVVRHHVAADGAVIFDDMHQGLSVIYDAGAFYRDPRLRYTVTFLIAAWLVYVLGSSNRLAPLRAARASARQRDFLEAVAGFLARRLDPVDAGRMLMDDWFDEIRRSRGLPAGGAPPWQELAATPTLGRATLARLQRCHARLASGRKVDLGRLQNTLRTAREAIG